MEVFQKGLGTKVKVSTTFLHQMDSQAEHTIENLEDMLIDCIIEFNGNWDKHLPLVEFSYINSYPSCISMAHFEALYGWRCRSPIGWFEVRESSLVGPNFFIRL